MIRRLLCMLGRHVWVTVRHHTENLHGQRCVRSGCLAARWQPGGGPAQGCADCYRAKLRKVMKASKKLGRQNRSARGLFGRHAGSGRQH